MVDVEPPCIVIPPAVLELYPKLADLFVDEISKSVASNSKF